MQNDKADKKKIRIPWDKVLWLITHAGAILKLIEVIRSIKIADGISSEEFGALGGAIADFHDATQPAEVVA